MGNLFGSRKQQSLSGVDATNATTIAQQFRAALLPGGAAAPSPAPAPAPLPTAPPTLAKPPVMPDPFERQTPDLNQAIRRAGRSSTILTNATNRSRQAGSYGGSQLGAM